MAGGQRNNIWHGVEEITTALLVNLSVKNSRDPSFAQRDC